MRARDIKVLVNCEQSGVVRSAFRKRGFDAYSCDILPAEDGDKHHYQMDALYVAGIRKWDLMIAHPPCTYLCNSGVCWLHPAKGARTKKNYTTLQYRTRWKHLIAAVQFFQALQNADIPYIAIENPIPHCYARSGFYCEDWLNVGNNFQEGTGKYSQIIQPWMFGHPETKATCLWLKRLPYLTETNNVKSIMMTLDKRQRNRLHWQPPGLDRWKIRSKTFQGIADAMAEQWGEYLKIVTYHDT